MKVVSTVWIPNSVADFEMHACLSIHAMRGAATRHCPYEVFVLDGFEKLPKNYISSLKAQNINIHDASKLTRKILKEYQGLNSFYSAGQGAHYETLCFIRWLVMKEVMKGDSFLHIDTDLFFQENNEFICNLFEGRTGTFGSPCLTSVSNPSWLLQYEDALARMLVDRSKFQADIGYKGNEFRKDISSDQDLVIAMESTGNIVNEHMSELNQAFQIFVNPLWPYASPPGRKIRYEDRGGRDFIDGKPVLFWHLQNNCADYISRYVCLKNYSSSWLSSYLPQRLCFPFIQLEPNAENFAFQALRDLSWRIIHQKQANGSVNIDDFGSEGFFARTWISRYFIIQRQGREIFTDNYWWEAGLFE
ncbi:hypothetical protein [Asticcacaulis sp. W401b]|uniref:hypothetical protein n=1 Tax=Asticcacaulis sp. W401b TaxID=3388666 RepID=UPI0039708008